MKAFTYAAPLVLLFTAVAFAQSSSTVANGQAQSIQSAPINSGGKANRVAPMTPAIRAELKGVAQSGVTVADPPVGSEPFNSGGKANRVAPLNAATRAELQDVAESGATVAEPPVGSAPFNSGGKANRIAPMNAATNSVLQGVHG